MKTKRGDLFLHFNLLSIKMVFSFFHLHIVTYLNREFQRRMNNKYMLLIGRKPRLNNKHIYVTIMILNSYSRHNL